MGMIFLKTGRAEYGDTGAYEMKCTEAFDKLAKDLPGEAELVTATFGALQKLGVFGVGGDDPV
jgi:hypothetical protein